MEKIAIAHLFTTNNKESIIKVEKDTRRKA